MRDINGREHHEADESDAHAKRKVHGALAEVVGTEGDECKKDRTNNVGRDRVEIGLDGTEAETSDNLREDYITRSKLVIVNYFFKFAPQNDLQLATEYRGTPTQKPRNVSIANECVGLNTDQLPCIMAKACLP